MSIMANCSASHRGSSQIGKILPRMMIFACFVSRARMEAPTFVTPCMQKGVLWCSLRIRAVVLSCQGCSVKCPIHMAPSSFAYALIVYKLPHQAHKLIGLLDLWT